MTPTLVLVLTYFGVAACHGLGAALIRVPLLLPRIFAAALSARTAPVSNAEVQLAAELRRVAGAPIPNHPETMDDHERKARSRRRTVRQ
jgi:hypothetical protein